MIIKGIHPIGRDTGDLAGIMPVSTLRYYVNQYRDPYIGTGGRGSSCISTPPSYYRVSSCLLVLEKGHIVFGGDLGW